MSKELIVIDSDSDSNSAQQQISNEDLIKNGFIENGVIEIACSTLTFNKMFNNDQTTIKKMNNWLKDNRVSLKLSDRVNSTNLMDHCNSLQIQIVSSLCSTVYYTQELHIMNMNDIYNHCKYKYSNLKPNNIIIFIDILDKYDEIDFIFKDSKSSKQTNSSMEEFIHEMEIINGITILTCHSLANSFNTLCTIINGLGKRFLQSKYSKNIQHAIDGYFLDRNNLNFIRLSDTDPLTLNNFLKASLMQINNISTDVANAICSKFKNIHHFIEYCSADQDEAQQYISNITLRRGYDLIANVSSIGLERAKKIVKIFSSSQPDDII